MGIWLCTDHSIFYQSCAQMVGLDLKVVLGAWNHGPMNPDNIVYVVFLWYTWEDLAIIYALPNLMYKEGYFYRKKILKICWSTSSTAYKGRNNLIEILSHLFHLLH